MCQKKISLQTLTGAKLLDGRIPLLEEDRERGPFIEHFCVTACFVKEITASLV